MDRIKRKLQQMAIKKALFTMVFIMALLVGILSATTIVVCTSITNNLLQKVEVILPSNENENQSKNKDQEYNLIIADDKDVTRDKEGKIIAVSTEYRIENLSLANKVLYYTMHISIVLLPFLFVVIGILLCAYFFYRLKMEKPFDILMNSAKRISNNDFDFKVDYEFPDEMGILCATFEKMRIDLNESNQKMWSMLEERRRMNASLAHDLRTPITVIKGYIEHLQRTIPRGKISDDKIMLTLSSLSDASKRLERYVDSVRDIQNMDTMALKKEELILMDVLNELFDGFEMLASQQGVRFQVDIKDIPTEAILIDKQIVARILENIFNNALRYSNGEVKFSCFVKENIFHAIITDNGKGFSDEGLKSACMLFYKEDTSSKHMGIGLAICAQFCQKHGGTITLRNNPQGGAIVEVTIALGI